jgi:phage-related protein
MKPITWCGDSLQRIREFPDGARSVAGHQLRRVQHGREPEDWKPMTTVGAGVHEIRIHKDGEFRVLYMAKFAEAIYVLHAFQKKARKMPQKDIDRSATRYRAIVDERRSKQP